VLPLYIPEFSQHPNLETSQNKSERNESIKSCIKQFLSESKCTNVVTGPTLFNELLYADIPKWEYVWK